MGIKTLKVLRMLIPGLMILVALMAVKESDWKSLTDRIMGIELSQGSFPFYGLPVIFGVLYYLANLRDVFFRKPIQRVVGNINDRLLSPFEQHPEIANSIAGLRESSAIKHIFYRFIDTEPDLQEKANNVRMNGLVLSSLADVAILCLIFAPIYLVIYIIKSLGYYLLLSVDTFIVFAFVRFFLLPLATKKHLKYSNEQIDSILANHYATLETRVLEVIRQGNGE